MTGDFEGMALYAGEGIDKVDLVMPAGKRVAAIISEARHLLNEAENN